MLLRHGESQWIADGRFQGQGDSPLTALGRQQVGLVAARLAAPDVPPRLPIPDGPPIAIVHSPLDRTTETARIVAAAVGAAHAGPVALRPETGLLEIGQGDWEGRPASEISARWGQLLAAWRTDPLSAWAPGGESLPEVDTRVRTGLRSTLRELASGRPRGSRTGTQVLGYATSAKAVPWSLLIGHDGVFRVVILALLDMPIAHFWAFPFALAGLTIIEIQGGRARLRAHNLVDHLAPLDSGAAAPARPAGAL